MRSRTPYPLVYGYVHNVREQPERFAEAKEQIELWCVSEGWHLGAVYSDVGSLLDVEDRIGFCGLVQALAMPDAAAAVLLNRDHLSYRPDVVAALVNQIRRTGAAVWLRDGELPEIAKKLRRGQAQWSR
ncbi:hypothetical protein [Actinokineospora xionganensis]|uniref:Resolvase-like protein n=1 Tax=Actinokineospora xionganensis TaxID=2684470 RepID=A0ABR7LH75_9PSEU|nr:hypothetical protein [Actinokineospora xionganensis]MBC6451642.1 hypothetical protein [Actinokineospora xionganensis]